jgi:hypothetical protein
LSSDEFDPYLEWLEIPLPRRPPTHYDLLGLAPFESDAERIQQAALKRIELVRRYKVGRREEAASRLERELTQAWNCLRDETRKKEYDAALRGARTHHVAQQTASESGPESRTDGPDAARAASREAEAGSNSTGGEMLDPSQIALVSPAFQAGAARAGRVSDEPSTSSGGTRAAGQSPFGRAGTRPSSPPGPAAREQSSRAGLKTPPREHGERAEGLTLRTMAMGAITACLSVLAVALLASGRGCSIDSLLQLAPAEPQAGVEVGLDVMLRGIAQVELVDRSGGPLGYTTMAAVDGSGLCVLCLRGREEAIPLKATTPENAAVFFRGAMTLDPGARLAAVSTLAAPGAVQPLAVPDKWPAPGTAVALAWCDGSTSGPRVLRGKLLRTCQGDEAASRVSDPEAVRWLNQRIEPLWEVDVGASIVSAGAVAWNERRELVGICVVARSVEQEPCLLLPGPELNRLLRAAQARGVRPLDEFSERFTSLVWPTQAHGAGGGMRGDVGEAPDVLPAEPGFGALGLPAGQGHGRGEAADSGAVPSAGIAAAVGEKTAAVREPPAGPRHMHELPGPGRRPSSSTLGPPLETAFAAGELGHPPERFPPLRVNDRWTLSWETLFDPSMIRSQVEAMDCGARVDVPAEGELGMSYVGHVRNGELHGWAAALSAEGVLRFIGGFREGRRAGQCWFYDRGGRLLLWADVQGESRGQMVLLADGVPELLLELEGAGNSALYHVQATPAGLRLGEPSQAAALLWRWQERERNQYSKEVQEMVAALQSAVTERGPLLGY